MPEGTPDGVVDPPIEPGSDGGVDQTGARRRAAIAGHTGDEDTARALLTHEDPVVRATALHALARLGRIDVSLIAAALDDPEPSVRRRALELAIPFHSIDLVPLLADPDDSVVEHCAWACGERLPAAAGVLESLCRIVTGHEDSLCREAAVAALGAIGDPRALPTILAATGDRATVRRRAIIALAPFEGPEVDRALALAKTDRDWQVRQAAEDLLDSSLPDEDRSDGGGPGRIS
ncbi:MAG: HEAT repeat domain-containing protein [Actinobacteria bacterium]|nr:HEAT repeat domain-containing protein [Actinomycetota bacterium]